MPRRSRGGPDRLRGRHKKSVSPETRAWVATQAPAERPAWMTAETFANLQRLRRKLEREAA